MVPTKESLMIKSAYGVLRKYQRPELQCIFVFEIVCTLFWFCGVFIYGSATSSRCGFYCGFNASFGDAFKLNNVGFDRPPTIYTTDLVTVLGIAYYMKWLTSIRQ